MISSEPVWTWLGSVTWGILGPVVHLLLDSGNGWPSPGRQGGQDCEGALISGKAPIGTRHAGPVTASTTPSRGRQISPKTPWSVIPRVRPRPGWHPQILTVLPRRGRAAGRTGHHRGSRDR